MAKRLVIYARELRDDDYDAIRLAYQQAYQQAMRDQRRQAPSRRSSGINWPGVAVGLFGILCALGLYALLVQ